MIRVTYVNFISFSYLQRQCSSQRHLDQKESRCNNNCKFIILGPPSSVMSCLDFSHGDQSINIALFSIQLFVHIVSWPWFCNDKGCLEIIFYNEKEPSSLLKSWMNYALTIQVSARVATTMAMLHPCTPMGRTACWQYLSNHLKCQSEVGWRLQGVGYVFATMWGLVFLCTSTTRIFWASVG